MLHSKMGHSSIVNPREEFRFYSKARMSCLTLCVTVHLYVKGENNIEVHLYRRLCVCVACGEAVPIGLAETKADVGGEAQ